jgi:hypothetical protein
VSGATDQYDSTLNLFHRPATATIIADPASPVTVTNVELDLVDLSGDILDTVYDGPIGTTGMPGDFCTRVNETNWYERSHLWGE